MHARSGESITVNHTILPEKLKYFGVRGVTNNWFKFFLQDRYQYTNVKECSSEKLLITKAQS